MVRQITSRLIAGRKYFFVFFFHLNIFQRKNFFCIFNTLFNKSSLCLIANSEFVVSPLSQSARVTQKEFQMQVCQEFEKKSRYVSKKNKSDQR